MANKKIKIKVNTRSRRGNTKPFGIMIATVSGSFPLKDVENLMHNTMDAVNNACNGVKNAVICATDEVKFQWIKMR